MNGSDSPVTPQRHIADLIQQGKTTEVGNAFGQEFQTLQPGAFKDLMHKVQLENEKDLAANSSLPGFEIGKDKLGNTEIGITTPGEHLGNLWRNEIPVFVDVARTEPDDPYRAKHDETVIAERYTDVMGFGHSKVIAENHSNAYMFNHSQYTAMGGSAVYADNSAKGTAENGSFVQAYGGSEFTAKAGSFLDARGHSQGTAENGSDVDAMGHSKYKAEAGSTVEAGEQSEGTAEAGARILADGNALIVAKAGSRIGVGSQGPDGVRLIGEPGAEVETLTFPLRHSGTELNLAADLARFNAPHSYHWHWGPTFQPPESYPPQPQREVEGLRDWQLD